MLQMAKTYNSGDSLVVTDPTTNPPVSGLTMGERTGSRIFHYLWSYVLVDAVTTDYIDNRLLLNDKSIVASLNHSVSPHQTRENTRSILTK